MKFSIGFDFGTNSCRGILVNISSGKEECEHVYNYKIKQYSYEILEFCFQKLVIFKI